MEFVKTFKSIYIKLIVMKDYLKIFSERLKDLRQEKGFTAQQLAKKIGVSEPTISRWENCMRIPNFLQIIALAEFFDVSLDYLTGLLDY